MWHEIYIGVLSKMRYQLQDMPPVSGRIQFGQFPKKKKKRTHYRSTSNQSQHLGYTKDLNARLWGHHQMFFLPA